MPNIRSIDMLFLDDLFAMGGGYVLNFSDRTMSQFFAEELNCDIDDPRYAVNGGSKGKRLRCFLQTVNIPTVVQVLKALWEYREAVRARDQQAETVENAEGRLLALINRLEEKPEAAKPAGQAPAPAFDRPRLLLLKADLLRSTSSLPKREATLLKNYFAIFSTSTDWKPASRFACGANRLTGAFSS